MRFHALLVVRDEVDVIEECLNDAATWCDGIYVYDTGSTDGTWEVVLDAGRRNGRVVPIAREAVFFSDGLRGVVFDRVRHKAEDGDWFVRLDADEFYPIPPPQFVAEQMSSYESMICNQTYEFRLTCEEVATYGSTDHVMADRKRSIRERRRYFVPLTYAEPRMFRYRRSMQWSPTQYGPWNAGYVARRRIPVLHYPHRDPIQLMGRLRLRAAMRTYMKSMDADAGTHWDSTDWRSLLIPQSDPRLLKWEPGSELPHFSVASHLAPARIRVLQRVAHAALLPALDRLRPKFPVDYHPEPIPPEVSNSLTVAAPSRWVGDCLP